MLQPNLSQCIDLFAQKLVIKNRVQTVVNHRPSYIDTEKTINATVQVARPDELKIDTVDFSLKYLYVHAPISSNLKINDLCEYKNKNYKCINLDPDNDYGYVECLFEEVK